MKTQSSVGVYDTYSTELSAALESLGCPLIGSDPLRRIFTEDRPLNPNYQHGINRGGKIQYRHATESTQFEAKTSELAQSFTTPEHTPDKTKGELVPRDPDEFDNRLQALREATKGTEVGILVEEIIREYPHEIARYISAAFQARNKRTKTVIVGKDFLSEPGTPDHGKPIKMTELVLIQKDDGHFVLHHLDLPLEQVEELLNA